MREIIEMTQDEIDEKVQNMYAGAHDWSRWRAFQDGLIDKVTTAGEIYTRKP